MSQISASTHQPPGFDSARWRAVDAADLSRPWMTLPDQLQRSSAGRLWSGLFVWHQVGPAGDLYVPPLDSHTILVRRSAPTLLLQRQGGLVSDGPWRPGEALVVPAGLPSFWRSPAARDNIHVNLDPVWLRRAAGHDAVLKSCFGRQDAVLAALAQVLLASLDSNTSLQPSFAEHMALAIAVHLLEHDAQSSSHRCAALGRRQMETLVDAVSAGLAQQWPLSRLAALAGLSPFHFSRAFKASFGTTPHDFIRTRRMDAAASLVRGTRKPFAEIAETVGYRTVSHFAQSFRRHWGVTPTAYRKGL